MSNPLRDAINDVLGGYVHARGHERIGRSSPTWERIMSIPQILAVTDVACSRPRVTVRASAGQGGWARIPWIALLHGDATNTTRAGIYVIYLFRADMSGVYLTVNQGVTEPLSRLGTSAGLAWVRDLCGAPGSGRPYRDRNVAGQYTSVRSRRLGARS